MNNKNIKIILIPLIIVGGGFIVFLWIASLQYGGIGNLLNAPKAQQEALEKKNFLNLQNPNSEFYMQYSIATQLTGGITACDKITQGEPLREAIDGKLSYTAEELITICREAAKQQNPKYAPPLAPTVNAPAVEEPIIEPTSTEGERDTIKTFAELSLLDSDDDGLTDLDEKRYLTDPNNHDTDGDGHTDGDEVESGYKPIKTLGLDTLSIPYSELKDLQTLIDEEMQPSPFGSKSFIAERFAKKIAAIPKITIIIPESLSVLGTINNKPEFIDDCAISSKHSTVSYHGLSVGFIPLNVVELSSGINAHMLIGFSKELRIENKEGTFILELSCWGENSINAHNRYKQIIEQL